jgi:Glycosyltransferase WbsX
MSAWHSVALAWVVTVMCMGAAHAQSPAQPAVNLGVFYYPGWKDDVPGAHPKPWDRIKPYSERKPLLGWYREGDVDVMKQQLQWMQGAGIDFVVFDWYWDGSRPWSAHALDAYLQAGNAQVKFAVMWANHGEAPKSAMFFESMARHWVDRYLHRSDYLRIEGKPVVFIMQGADLNMKASRFGSSAQELLARAQQMAREAGLPEILFVSGGGGGSLLPGDSPKPSGFGGYFAYNYHSGPNGQVAGQSRLTRGYDELDQAYRSHWDWMVKRANAPYMLPLTSGWDKRPWGGSKDPLHDASMASPAQFRAHLLAARSVLEANPRRTFSTAVVCCWNEYGEGSFIEPTEQAGARLLDEIKGVFGP